MPLRLIHSPHSHDVLLRVEEVSQGAHILTWDLALGTANSLVSICATRNVTSYSHKDRSTSFLNSFHTLFHVVRGDRDSDRKFLLVGIVGVHGRRDVVRTFDFLEGAVAAAFLEHVVVGLCILLASLMARGYWHSIFPSEDIFVELHRSVNILNWNLSPGDGARLFLFSTYKDWAGQAQWQRKTKQ